MRGDWRLLVVSTTALVVGAGLTGAVVAGRFGGPGDPDELASAMRNGAMVRVANIDAAAGLPSRGVFVQTTSTGQLCLWDAPSSGGMQRGGGCNSIDDPLGGAKLSASLSYEGGPGVKRVSDARLVGLVASDVASVQVVMSDGTRRSVAMARQVAVAMEAKSYRAFGYRFAVADLKRGIEPKAVVALNARGLEIDRQATGFAG